jgi:hypothetical protein
MSEKQEENFEEDADELVGESEDPDIERVNKDLELAKRRGNKGGGDPAWRRLELLMEERRTAELLSDLEDYDIGDGERRRPRSRQA